MDSLYKILIYLIASYLPARWVLALRLVCKKFSTIPLNRFRLIIKEGILPPGEYYYVTYTGNDYNRALFGCTIRKLYLPYYPKFIFHPSISVGILVTKSDASHMNAGKKIIHTNFRKLLIPISGNYQDCCIGGAPGFYKKKNFYTTSLWSGSYPQKKITDFKKIIITQYLPEIHEWFACDIKKLHICNNIGGDIQLFKNLTYLKWGHFNYETKITLPAGILKLTIYGYLDNRGLPFDLPPKLEKLKIKNCSAEILDSLVIPSTLKLFKISLSGNAQSICVPNGNFRFIVKF
jgi:hypothetical protein